MVIEDETGTEVWDHDEVGGISEEATEAFDVIWENDETGTEVWDHDEVGGINGG